MDLLVQMMVVDDDDSDDGDKAAAAAVDDEGKEQSRGETVGTSAPGPNKDSSSHHQVAPSTPLQADGADSLHVTPAAPTRSHLVPGHSG